MSVRFLLILMGALCPLAMLAQQQAIGQVGAAGQANLDALANGASAVVPRGESYGLIGTPYLDKRWLQARLRMSNGVPLAPVPIKYDILNQRLLMRPLNRQDSLLLNDPLLAGFELEVPAASGQPAQSRTFRRFTEAPVPAQRSEYVEVLHTGRYTLLKRYAKVLHKANNQGAYNSGERYDQVEDKTMYFLKRPDNTLVPVKLNLKALQAAAPELAPALKAAPNATSAKTDAEWAAVLAAADK